MSTYNKFAHDKYRATHKEVLKERNRINYINNAEKNREKSKNRYKNNINEQRKYHRQYMQEIRDIIAVIKIKRGCIDCGYNEHSAALDFDHVGDDKVFNMQKFTSLEKALVEIEKCEVRCSNCHRIITFKRRLIEEISEEDLQDSSQDLEIKLG